MTDLHSLLTRAADEAGSFTAPPAAALRRRARRQTAFRTVTAVASVVVLVAALAVGLSLRGHRSTPTAHGFDASLLPGPSGHVVTAAQLANYQWDDLPQPPFGGRDSAVGVWTGSELIVWGGTDGNDYFADGASYDPQSRAWSALPTSPLSARTDSAYAWVGGELIIWGGQDSSGQLSDGARYDPASREWSMLPTAPLGAGELAQGFAVGADFVVVATDPQHESGTAQAAAFDVAHDSWQQLPDLTLPADHDLFFAVGLAAGDTLFLWAYWFHSVKTGPGSFETTSGTDAYALQNGAWWSVPVEPRRGASSDSPLWTGTAILLPAEDIYCGPCSHPINPNRPGESIDPASGSHTEIADAPSLMSAGPFVWTGGALLAVADPGNTPTGSSGAWDPASGSWTRLPAMPLDSSGVAVWTGDRLLVLSGSGASGGVEFAPPN